MTQSTPATTPDATFDPQVFLRENRIHVKDGSLFLSRTLVLHPTELDPAHEPALRDKLKRIFTLNEPSYFSVPEYQILALVLGELVPASLTATHAKLTQEIAVYNQQAAVGAADKTAEQPIIDRQHPLAAAARESGAKPKSDPVGSETLKNGVIITLLLQEALRKKGFTNDLKAYVLNAKAADQIIGDLQRHLDITPLQFREAAAHGIDAVGTLLGLDAPSIGSIKSLVEESQKHEFSSNIIKNYFYGREKSAPNAPLHEVLATGLKAKIDEKIPKFRAMVKNKFTAPEPIQKEEARIVEALKLVDPVQLESLYLQGYEIAYTPDEYADKIAFYPGIHGLHIRPNNDPHALTGGSPRIYFAGGKGLEKAHGTLVHEIAHNVFPARFSKEQVAAMEGLIAKGDAHISKLHHFLTNTTKEAGLTPLEQQQKLHDAYMVGDDKEKAAVAAEANKLLAPVGITFEALKPYLHKPETLERLTTSVARAHMDLRIEGSRYLHGGSYDNPAARVREMISRFAELKQVVLRDTPEMLNFIAPHMNELFEQHYIPHLREVNAAIKHQHTAPAAPLIAPPPAPTTEAAPVTDEAKKDPSAKPPIAKDDAAIAPVAPPPLALVPKPTTPPKDEHKAPVAPPPTPAPQPTTAAASLADHSASCTGCAACGGREQGPSAMVDASSLNPQGFAAAKVLQELTGASASI
jgi:hypothetical protein